MSVVMAINGVVEQSQAYLGAAGDNPQRKKPSHGKTAPGGKPPQARDSVALAVQQAYQQIPQPTTKRPAILAQDIMTSPVIFVSPEAPLTKVWVLMHSKGFRHIPIVSTEGRLVGIVSDRDLLRFSKELSTGVDLPYKIGQIMQANLLVATPTTEIIEIARAMLDAKINAMPIVDGLHHPVGMLTTSDILRGLVARISLEVWT